MLRFISSRRNWDSPTPHPQASVPPPPQFWGGGGAHSLAREGLGESQFRRGDIHCGTLYIYVFCDYNIRAIYKYVWVIFLSVTNVCISKHKKGPSLNLGSGSQRRPSAERNHEDTKHEIFGSGVFTQIRPLGLGDLGTRHKNRHSVLLSAVANAK